MLVPELFRRNAFDDFFEYPFAASHASASIMKTDVKETETGYELTVDIPGVKKEDVKADLKDGYLTISAVTSQSNDEQDSSGNYIRRERFSGSYSRSFYIGEDIWQEDIKAKFENGVLTLNIPKKEAKPAVEEKKYITIE